MILVLGLQYGIWFCYQHHLTSPFAELGLVPIIGYVPMIAGYIERKL